MLDLLQMLPTFLRSRIRGSVCMFELHEIAKQAALTVLSMKLHELSRDWKMGVK